MKDRFYPTKLIKSHLELLKKDYEVNYHKYRNRFSNKIEAIIELRSEGLSRKEICNILHIPIKTLEGYITKINKLKKV